MKTDFTAEEKLRRAENAQRLLDDPLFKEALAAIEQRSFDEILTLPMTEEGDAQRRTLVQRVSVIRDVRRHLESVMTDGKQAGRRKPSVV